MALGEPTATVAALKATAQPDQRRRGTQHREVLDLDPPRLVHLRRPDPARRAGDEPSEITNDDLEPLDQTLTTSTTRMRLGLRRSVILSGDKGAPPSLGSHNRAWRGSCLFSRISTPLIRPSSHDFAGSRVLGARAGRRDRPARARLGAKPRTPGAPRSGHLDDAAAFQLRRTNILQR